MSLKPPSPSVFDLYAQCKKCFIKSISMESGRCSNCGFTEKRALGFKKEEEGLPLGKRKK